MKRFAIIGAAILAIMAPVAASRRAALLAIPKPNTAIDPNLVGWWKLNDGSGTSAADSTGNANTGTLSGNPTWGTGPNSNGDLIFDGTGDFVTIDNESNFDFERTDDFSITFWVNLNVSAAGSKIVWEKSSTIGNQQGYAVVIDADNGRIRVFVTDILANALISQSGNGSITAGVWSFVSVTYDGSSDGGGLKVYIDAGTAATGSGTLSTTILNNASPNFGGSAGGFFGALDDGRVYNKELSSGEVTALNSGGAK